MHTTTIVEVGSHPSEGVLVDAYAPDAIERAKLVDLLSGSLSELIGRQLTDTEYSFVYERVNAFWARRNSN